MTSPRDLDAIEGNEASALSIDALEALLKSRRSVRAFKEDAVPRDLTLRVLSAAVLAPSASNKQPWRFFILENRATLASLANTIRTEKERISSHIAPEIRDSFVAYGDYFTRFERAPLVIAVAARSLTILSNLVDDSSETPLDHDTIATIKKMEDDSGLVGSALAIGNMLLAAHALGLGASAMTGPLIARGAVERAFEVPKGWSIVALVALGFADESPKPTDRKDATIVTRWIR
jgi:nitroreductase